MTELKSMRAYSYIIQTPTQNPGKIYEYNQPYYMKSLAIFHI